jgi:hypothetical protein
VNKLKHALSETDFKPLLIEEPEYFRVINKTFTKKEHVSDRHIEDNKIQNGFCFLIPPRSHSKQMISSGTLIYLPISIARGRMPDLTCAQTDLWLFVRFRSDQWRLLRGGRGGSSSSVNFII